MMDKEYKRKLYLKTQRNVYLKHFLSGLKELRKSLGKIFIVGVLVSVYFILLFNEKTVEPPKPEAFKDATDYFGVFYFLLVSCIMLPLIFLLLVIFGMPTGAKHYHDNFQRAGMANDAGEAPSLMSKTFDPANPRIQILEFYSLGFPLSYWQDHMVG